jgi:hypothetical protein
MTVEDAARLALALPEVSEGTRFGNRTWFVGGQGFAWERPLSKADIRRLRGEPPPEGPLLAVRVANLEEKEVLMMDPPHGFFDIEHFRGYPAVLIRLQLIDEDLLEAALVEAWHACAPPSLSAGGPPRPHHRMG